MSIYSPNYTKLHKTKAAVTLFSNTLLEIFSRISVNLPKQNLHITKLNVLYKNLQQLWKFFQKAHFCSKTERVNEYYRILNIWINLSTKFYFKEIILSFWASIAQKCYVRCKIKTWTSPLNKGYSWSSTILDKIFGTSKEIKQIWTRGKKWYLRLHSFISIFIYIFGRKACH